MKIVYVEGEIRNQTNKLIAKLVGTGMLSRAKPDFFKKALIYLLLFISLAVLLSPLILIFLTSIKDQSQIYDLMQVFYLLYLRTNYIKAFHEIDFLMLLKILFIFISLM